MELIVLLSSALFLFLALYYFLGKKAYGLSEREEGDMKGRVILAKFDSTQGYLEKDVIDLIAYLGSHGISAHYQKSSAGAEFAPLETYFVTVPMDVICESQQLLSEWLKN